MPMGAFSWEIFLTGVLTCRAAGAALRFLGTRLDFISRVVHSGLSALAAVITQPGLFIFDALAARPSEATEAWSRRLAHICQTAIAKLSTVERP